MENSLAAESTAAPFFERAPWNQRGLILAAAVALAAVDFFTGPYILFPIFFVAPVMLMAWNCGFGNAFGLAIGLSLARLSFHFSWSQGWPVAIALINAVMRGGMLSLLAFITARLAKLTRALRERVKTLEGILPVCGFCKDIRDEDGAWHRMEYYVTERTEARFTHGVCPCCADRHYGDILRQARSAA